MQPRQDSNVMDDAPTGDLLVTGASGFLGSQFVTEWLQRHPTARVGCLLRAADDDAAAARLHIALLRAADDRGIGRLIDGLLPRATAIRGELSDHDWLEVAAGWRAGSSGRELRVLHCAANLSFRAADRDAVRTVNIEGTRAMLTASARLGATEFNYVSTAYVAGDRSGCILEETVGDAPSFSNAYEESKWQAEALVRDVCGELGLSFRILRPSIIIAHSVTHRMAALSGFYKVMETMLQLGRSTRARGQTILLPLPQHATLDLIPVDVVVNEMMQLLDLGDASLGQAFHLTSDNPLSLVEVLATLSPLSGLAIDRLPDDSGPATALAEFIMQRLRHYMPYLGQIRQFDRSNMRAAGIARQDMIDVRRLRGYVDSFLAAA